MGNIFNQGNLLNSLQVSIIGDIGVGSSFKPGFYFLIKNISDLNIDLLVLPASSQDLVWTVFYPGWNPELIKEIVDPVLGLQYGY